MGDDMQRRMRILTGAVAVVAGAATAFGQQAGASEPAGDQKVDRTSMAGAMQRDLGLSDSEVDTRLKAEKAATTAEKQARQQLGQSFGGAWFDAASGKLVVGAKGDAASTMRSSSATEVRQVARSERQLTAYQARLDAAKASAPDTVPGWYVDVTTNKIVVQSREAGVGQAKAFAKKAGVPTSAVTVEVSSEAPRALDVVGGNAFYIGGSRCSIGFAVTGGFVTAGHCGSRGDTTSSPSGTFAGSSFPGNDYAYVQTPGQALIGAVNNYAGGTVRVQGSSDAPVGSSICRSGSTTGWRCGTIQARNASVTYVEGTITGLIRTSACAEPGDSGGSAISGTQAQGVTSGGSGNCSSGGTTYFQPVNEILGAYGVSLITS
jgi:streptogrisin C